LTVPGCASSWWTRYGTADWTWEQIARVYGYPSGKQAKKIIHALRERVQRELRLAGRNG
jgi:hypothetical protein